LPAFFLDMGQYCTYFKLLHIDNRHNKNLFYI
jgi:hypothetical protein